MRQLLQFAAGVQPVQLADPRLNYDNVSAVVTGWGALYKKEDHEGPYADILQAGSAQSSSSQFRSSHWSSSDITALSLVQSFQWKPTHISVSPSLNNYKSLS